MRKREHSNGFDRPLEHNKPRRSIRRPCSDKATHCLLRAQEEPPIDVFQVRHDGVHLIALGGKPGGGATSVGAILTAGLKALGFQVPQVSDECGYCGCLGLRPPCIHCPEGIMLGSLYATIQDAENDLVQAMEFKTKGVAIIIVQ